MHPPGLCATPAPQRRDRLWLLAVASLALAVVVEALCAVGLAQSDSSSVARGSNIGLYLQMAASILWIHALLSGVAPAVLAEGQRAFRFGLIMIHILIGWLTQIAGYGMLFPSNADIVGEMASGILIATLGMFAGLWGVLSLLAMLCGWRLTPRPDDARRVTFSVRGILVATAAAALLFASPRVLTPLVTSTVKRIHVAWTGEHPWDAAIVGFESEFEGQSPAMLVMPLVVGALLAITLVSAMWLGRWGWLGVILGAMTAASLALLGESMSGSPISSFGVAAVVFTMFLAGSLLATLQIAIWKRFGWRLVRIRRGTPAGPSTRADSNATPDAGDLSEGSA